MTVTVKGPGLASLEANVRKLLKREVLIGIPADKAARSDGDGSPVNNAAIGYAMEFGDPERNIPERSFLRPGVEAVRDKAVENLKIAAQAALIGNEATIDARLHAVGLIGQTSVRQKILSGPFAPLSNRTLEARASRRNGKGKLSQAATSKQARKELAGRAKGAAPSTDAKPLYDTHSLFNSINYIVRPKGK